MSDPDLKRKVHHEELPQEHEDPLIRHLHFLIRAGIRVLAVLMALVIIWGVADVIWILYQRLSEPPVLLLDISDLFETFGAFLAVLIAIEIFINIRLYLGADVLPVQLVIATALMAISRKIIVLDFEKVSPDYILASAATVLALGLTYWLISKKP
ncbi:MAG: phosphate-starvation-inducible PsiE family protein [Chromatiaceae bacterium]